jgi:hypothetical protein
MPGSQSVALIYQPVTAQDEEVLMASNGAALRAGRDKGRDLTQQLALSARSNGSPTNCRRESVLS